METTGCLMVRIANLVLIDGQFREFSEIRQHWFDLNDVFYTDLTGDGSPEAIVMLTHLECGSNLRWRQESSSTSTHRINH